MAAAEEDRAPERPDPKEMDEHDLWELIDDNRHRLSLGVRPGTVIPYLRQARVLTEVDEDEILSSHKLSNRSMRISYMLDLLRTQGKNGAMAFLESLMIHHPSLYTHVTGRQPSMEPSGFSGLIKYSELTEYLVRAVTEMQSELHEAKQEAGHLRARCSAAEAELSRAVEQGEESRRLLVDRELERRQLAAARQEIGRLKDEKCDLCMRYTAAVEEKSAVNVRSRDLNLQVYQLQLELRKAETESQRHRSLKCETSGEALQLREEISTLRRQLLEAEKFAPAREDILVQDLAEAMDSHTELAEQLRGHQQENERLARDKDQLLQQKEQLSMEVEKLALDCTIYQQKSLVVHGQLRELQTERDHAYQSRDEAQAQIARSLGEKDLLRSQLVELQETMLTRGAWRGGRGGGRPEPAEARELSWGSRGSSSEGPPPSPPPSPPPRARLRRMPAINPSSLSSFNPEYDDDAPSSMRSRKAEPPCPESLRRREDLLLNSDHSLDHDFVFIPDRTEEAEAAPPVSPCSADTAEGLSRASAPPFLVRSRPRALRVSGRVLTISFQGGALLGQLQVVGGNKTGVFVHRVTEGSAAHAVGIGPGAQIVEVKYEQAQQALKMVLEDSTLEEALWALAQVQGFCHLSLRPNQDAYERLLQQLDSGEVSSGDSFYVRVNMSLGGGVSGGSGGGGALGACCGDVLHVTDTRPAGATDGSWRASHVHPTQLRDLQAGTVPNYYRAQPLLIRAIEDMSLQLPGASRTCLKAGRVASREKRKAVRIVSTGRQGRNPLWVSVEQGDAHKNAGPGAAPGALRRGCVTLTPYSLVTPRHPPVCRPVLLLPTVLGRVLDGKLAEWEGFQLCRPEVLSSGERVARLQRSEVLEECEQGGRGSYTLQSVERVMKQGIHCVLPMGLDCVRRLHRAEIFPIIIFIAQSPRSARKLRSKLARHGWSEGQLLECCRSEEPLLDKLPSLYRRVPPGAWGDSAALLALLRSLVCDEQKKIVWVEPDLC